MVRARRLAHAVIAVLVVVVVAAVPAAAAPESITEELIRGLNRRLLYIAVPIAVLVEFILLYTVWRFRDNDDPKPTRTNRDLEITWTVATALVLLFVGSASYAVLTSPYVAAMPDLGAQAGDDATAPEPADAPSDAVVVEIVAEQWNYTFEYANGSVATQDELVVPENRTLYLYVTSEEVLHSVHVPELGLKQDAFPNQYNLIRTRVGDTGQYRLYCAEFCGTGHAGMRSTMRVVEQDEYRAWLDDRRNETAGEEQQSATADDAGQNTTEDDAGQNAAEDDAEQNATAVDARVASAITVAGEP